MRAPTIRADRLSAPHWRIVGTMLTDWQVMKRRLREGAEFLRFLRLRSAA